MHKAALALGTANQLTNILRDVGEDAVERNRIYVPLDELDQFGIRESEVVCWPVLKGVQRRMPGRMLLAETYPLLSGSDFPPGSESALAIAQHSFMHRLRWRGAWCRSSYQPLNATSAMLCSLICVLCRC